MGTFYVLSKNIKTFLLKIFFFFFQLKKICILHGRIFVIGHKICSYKLTRIMSSSFGHVYQSILKFQGDTSVVVLTVLCFGIDFCVVCALCAFSCFMLSLGN